MKRLLRCATILGVLTCVACGVFLLKSRNTAESIQVREFEVSSNAFVVLANGRTPFLVEVRVIDRAGNPVTGAVIDVRNNSGGNAGTTDRDGRVSIELGEREIEQVLLDGQPVVNRPRAYELGYPSVDKGLRVLIIKKD